MNDHRSRDEQTKRLKIHSTAMITLAFISFPAVQNMIQFMSLPHHRVYNELTMACSLICLISLMDRALRPIIVKGRQGSILGQP